MKTFSEKDISWLFYSKSEAEAIAGFQKTLQAGLQPNSQITEDGESMLPIEYILVYQFKPGAKKIREMMLAENFYSDLPKNLKLQVIQTLLEYPLLDADEHKELIRLFLLDVTLVDVITILSTTTFYSQTHKVSSRTKDPRMQTSLINTLKILLENTSKPKLPTDSAFQLLKNLVFNSSTNDIGALNIILQLCKAASIDLTGTLLAWNTDYYLIAEAIEMNKEPFCQTLASKLSPEDKAKALAFWKQKASEDKSISPGVESLFNSH